MLHPEGADGVGESADVAVAGAETAGVGGIGPDTGDSGTGGVDAVAEDEGELHRPASGGALGDPSLGQFERSLDAAARGTPRKSSCRG